jgi:predicted lipoprotein with Yx(FWY)xxD motif
MRRTIAGVALCAALAIVAAACSGSNDNSSGSSSGTAAPATTAAPASNATVTLASTKFGQVLADSQGKILYMYTKDKPNSSVCTGECLGNWPALKATGTPTAGSGVDSSLLGTIQRTDDGSMQVTYKGQPLYHFAGDSQTGDVNGQNVGGIWFVLGADGNPIKTTS